VHDEEKPFELEISWICDASDREFRRVPDAILEAAEQQAKASLEESDMCAQLLFSPVQAIVLFVALMNLAT
jgi:hypothetical protein